MTIEKLRRLSLDHPAATIATFAAITLALGGGALRANFSTDYRIFFPPTDPKLMALESLENVFTKTDNIAFVVKPRSGDVFQHEALSAIAELTEASWKLPDAVRVDSLTNFQHSFIEDDDLVVRDLDPRPHRGPDAGGPGP